MKKKYYRSGEVDWSEKIRNKEPLSLQTRGSEFRSLAHMEKLNETRTYCPGAGEGKRGRSQRLLVLLISI